MSLLFIVLGLVAVAGVGSHTVPTSHECVHSKYIEPAIEKLVKSIESIPMETHRSANAFFNPVPRRTLLASTEPEPIRIHVEYQIDNLKPDQIKFMKNDLMPAVRGVFQRVLNIKTPVRGRLYLPWACVSTFVGYPGYCHQVGHDCGTARHNKDFFGPGRTCVQPYDDQCIDLPRGKGVADADFILYVTAKVDVGCASSSETVASAGFCTYDMDDWYGLPNRPLAGVANFCPNNIYTEEDMFGYMLDTAVHEVLHALVMSKQLFEKFVDSRGNPRRGTVTESGGSLVIRTPAVIDAARNILGCPSMEGANLENEGGYGTAESHWERRLFIGEIMIGSSSASSRVVFSNLTLALAADSGWYVPKYHNSGVLRAVEHRGCGFVQNDCRWYNKALEETFCWNSKPVSQQPAVCTADHMAIGYCKNDMSLMGDCSIVQPYKNTHCTNKEHHVETQHVDLGMRHKPGARCFPVSSYQISRTEDYYTVYRSDLGAACFDTVCKGKNLYVRIPATSEHKQKDIRCPTGKTIDLSNEDLGFDEGLIGPCPQNDLVCESWGCKADCSSHGTCLNGECYCDIGYVGESCDRFACPHNPCKSNEECHLDSGTCYATGFGRTEAGSGKATKPVESPIEFPEVVDPVVLAPAPPSPTSVPLTKWAPRPSTGFEPSKKPEPTDLPEGEEITFKPAKPAPKAKTPEAEPGEEPFVPSTQPKKGKKGRPDKSPDLKEPKRPSPSTYSVPAYRPLAPSAGEFASGRVAAVGFLHSCLLFEDTFGDSEVRPETVRRYTGDLGEWSVDPFPQVDELVVDPKYGDSCYDVFTDLRPVWRLRGFTTVRTLSGISTLAALTPKAKKYALANSSAVVMNKRSRKKKDDQEDGEYPRYAMEADILTALGLKDKYILQRDFVTEAFATNDKEAKRAVVYNAMISNTVIQISCFVDASKKPSYETADYSFRMLGHNLEGGVDLDKLVHTDTVYLLLEQVIRAQSNGRNSWLVAEATARTNQLAYSYLSKYDGVELLGAMARLTVAAQTTLCELAADLESGTLDWSTYSKRTSKHSIKDLMDKAKIAEIAPLMKPTEPAGNAAEEEEVALDVPFLDFQLKETVFMGMLMVMSVLAICMLRAWYQVRHTSH